MILCDREIQEALRQNRLLIDPFPDADHMASTSVDLRLAAQLDRWEFPEHAAALGLRFRPAHEDFIYKSLERQYTKPIRLEQHGYDLAPHHFILGYTLERIYLPHSSRLCARVEGKSSL